MVTCQYTTLRGAYKVLTVDVSTYLDGDVHVFRSGSGPYADIYAVEGTTLYKWSRKTGRNRKIGTDATIGGTWIC